MKGALIILGVLVLLVVILGGSLMGSRNELVAEREAIHGSWAQVDSALQRRLDLIPNLVETVKGAAGHEEKVIGEVTAARAAMMGAKTPGEKIEANNQLSGALGRLMVVVENYPNIKANENFLKLQDELAGTENRINIMRLRYNETVQKYNTDIALFPKNIAAGIFGFQREDAYFKADTAAKEAPKVKF
ncbi:MAG TPA: LemA family protein [Bryobacteraceae bacterium]|jgi:LemA protein|nr:LemA family protein [Bryobacteraceae bacterium]